MARNHRGSELMYHMSQIGLRLTLIEVVSPSFASQSTSSCWSWTWSATTTATQELDFDCDTGSTSASQVRLSLPFSFFFVCDTSIPFLLLFNY
ncbi:hypothetical protein ACSBR1_024399 [Camellia fascicularis]